MLETATQDSKTFTYTHDPNGNVSAIVYPNGVNCDVTYDHRNQITQLAYKRGTTQLLTLSYTYDQSGLQRTAKRDTPDRDDNRTYDYDKRLQVTNTSRVIRAGGATTRLGRGYTYDDNYNRQSMRVNNTTTVNYSTDPTDRLNSTGNTTFGYNTNGNVDRITEGGNAVTLTYNHADQVTQLSGAGGTATYVYDGNGQRIKRTPPGGSEIRYLWAGDEVLKEYHSDGAVQYLLGTGREGLKKDGSWKFYLTDAQGSVVALTDEQGTVTDTWEYGDFGETTRLTGSSYNPYLYTGQQFDPEFGGHYFLRARLYHPQYGRFLSRDPIGWEGGSNVFAYCDNNSLNSSDPSGLLPPDGPANDRHLQSRMKSNIPVPLPPLSSRQTGTAPPVKYPDEAIVLTQGVLMWVEGEFGGRIIGGIWSRVRPAKSNLSGLKANVGAAGANEFSGSVAGTLTETGGGTYKIVSTLETTSGTVNATARLCLDAEGNIIIGLNAGDSGAWTLGYTATKQWMKSVQEAALKLYPQATGGSFQYSRYKITSSTAREGLREIPFTR